MTVLTLTPASPTALMLFGTPKTLYPSATTYPSGGAFPGVTSLTLAPKNSSALTLTPA